MPIPNNRDELDDALRAEVDKVFRDSRNRIANAIYVEGMTASELENIPEDEWQWLNNALKTALGLGLLSLFLRMARQMLTAFQYALAEDELMREAQAWVDTHIESTANDMLGSRQRYLQRVIDRNPDAPLTRKQLMATLREMWGNENAILTAKNETTLAISAGEALVMQKLQGIGWQLIPIWFTSEDDRVCAKCAPLNIKRRGDGWVMFPPLHVGCRCGVEYIAINSNGEQFMYTIDGDLIPLPESEYVQV